MDAFVAPRHGLHGVSHTWSRQAMPPMPPMPAMPASGRPSEPSKRLVAGSVAAVVVASRRRSWSFHPSGGRTWCAASEDLAKAVAEGRMITVEESTLRKAAGGFFLVLFLWQALLVLSTGAATLDIEGSSYATLALLASNSLGFAGSGFLNL